MGALPCDSEHLTHNPAQGEWAAAKILECIDSMPWPAGRNKIARILKGSAAQDILKLDLHRIRHYGALGHLTLAQISGAIEQLIAAGYVRSTFGRRPVLMLTSAGRTAIVGGDAPEVNIPDDLMIFIARERCRRCPHNPSVALSSTSAPDDELVY